FLNAAACPRPARCAYGRLPVSYSTCATAIVIPRSRSSGALSIDPYSRTAIVLFFVCSTLVIAAVNVVLPWSMCPIVPTFTCGFVRSYFAFAIVWPPTGRSQRDPALSSHTGLDPHRLGPAAASRDPQRGGDLDRHLGRVDLVIRAVGQSHPDVDDRVAGEHTGVERLADPLLDRRNVFPRDGAADDLVLELEALARLVRLHLEVDVAVLAAATGLPHVAALRLGGLTDRLAIGNLGLADVGLHLELAQEAVDDDLQVELAHPVDQGLRGLLVAGHAERRILECEP